MKQCIFILPQAGEDTVNETKSLGPDFLVLRLNSHYPENDCEEVTAQNHACSCPVKIEEASFGDGEKKNTTLILLGEEVAYK